MGNLPEITVALIGLISAGIGGLVTLLVADRRDRWQHRQLTEQERHKNENLDRDRLIDYYEKHINYLVEEARYWRGRAEGNLDRYEEAIGVGRNAAHALSIVDTSEPAPKQTPRTRHEK